MSWSIQIHSLSKGSFLLLYILWVRNKVWWHISITVIYRVFILTALKIPCLLIHLSLPTYPHNHWFLIFSMCFTKSLRSCATLGNPMDCSPPGFSVHGILQARILEWVAMPSSRGSSWPRDWTHVSYVPWHVGSLPLEPSRKTNFPHSFSFSVLYNWNHTVCGLLRLASFT